MVIMKANIVCCDKMAEGMVFMLLPCHVECIMVLQVDGPELSETAVHSSQLF